MPVRAGKKTGPGRAIDAAGPLYMKIVRALSADILSGKMAVGARLPTEAALCRQFNVSRHTLREALRHLREAGLISSRQGSGSVVTGSGEPRRYVHAVSSLSELLQYARDTRFEIDRTAMVTADGKLAARLNCSPGRRWLYVTGYRYVQADEPPICWVEVYIHASLARVGTLLKRNTGSVFGLIEKQSGERIEEVGQTLRAAVIPRAVATGLDAKAGSAALEIERVYKSAKQRVLEVSFSLHPLDRFSYSMVIRREPSGRKRA